MARPTTKKTATSRSPQKKTSRRTTKTKTHKNSSHTKTTAASKSTFTLSKEIKGIVLIVFAVILTMGLFGSTLGVVGTFFQTVLNYGFGIGAFLPVLALYYWGWNLLYHGQGFHITVRGVLYTLLILCGLAVIPLWNLPVGKELEPIHLVNNGGILGNSIAAILRYLLADAALIVDIALIIVLAVIITGTSIGRGMRKASEKASVGMAKAKEKASVQLAGIKEQVADLQEQYRREDIPRKAYDQAKDPRYPVNVRELDKNNEIGNQSEKQEKIELASGVENQTEAVISPNPSDAMLQEGESIQKAVVLLQENSTQKEPVLQEAKPDQDNVMTTENISLKSHEAMLEEAIDMYEPMHEAIEPFVSEEKTDHHEVETIEKDDMPVSTHIVEAIHNPENTYEGAAAETSAVSVSIDAPPKPRRIEMPYRYPSLDILARGKAPEGLSEEIEQKAELLESTLDSFGIKARIINATQGPAVTRYELEPARGVKVSKIVNLTDDIALNLAAAGIRMEAPIPGKAAIGIEIPNKKVTPVNLRDVLECDEFLKAKGGIPVGLGKDIAGKSVITDLSKMPHLLVAGSTGSGKSVCVNTLISSILFSRKPDEVKMILIDPKMVELSNYNGVPHLMTPVVTDMKKAASVLRWAVKEMESRYRAFAEANVRDVSRYNETHPDTAMPLIVIIIDELADLMMVSPVDVEDSICRLAQMARAAGLHLVLATQRPSVDVITGTIKANVPSRISFAVSSQIDSRTILDMAGAEKLLGKGDMLFNPIGANKPVRIQGAFISDDEVERLVSFVKRQGEPKYDERIMAAQEQSMTNGGDEIVEDELLKDAIDYVMDAGQASTSMLQRKLRIGFTRAGRLMDAMEQMNIIGPNVGSKPRDLLMTRAQVYELYFSEQKETTY